MRRNVVALMIALGSVGVIYAATASAIVVGFANQDALVANHKYITLEDSIFLEKEMSLEEYQSSEKFKSVRLANEKLRKIKEDSKSGY